MYLFLCYDWIVQLLYFDSFRFRILFTDSIGSFGSLAPREHCTARWLTENPLQEMGVKGVWVGWVVTWKGG